MGKESNSLENYLQFAKNTALKAGAMAIKLRPSAFIEKNKDGLYNYATNADIQVENFILGEIKKNFPDHAVLTEESGEHNTNSPYRWVVDPIDGTWQYKTGQSHYAILIALENENNLILSVAYFPQIKDLYESSQDKGTFFNGQKVKVSSNKDLAACFVYINHPSFKTPPDDFDWKFNLIKKLTLSTYKTFPSHSASFDLLKIAQGAVDGLISSKATGGWWDMATGIAAILNSGGQVTTFQGTKATDKNFRDGYIASNGKIHNKLINLVKSVK